jgi:hypothetical protein
LRQGEIRQLLSISSQIPQYAVVLSGPIHLSANTGRVITCRVIPGVARADFAGVQQVTYTGPDGVTTIGLAVPELVEWHPASGLGPSVGTVSTPHSLLRLVRSLFD